MIETRFNISINIDAKVFDITVNELSPIDKKKLESIGEEQKNILLEQSLKEKKVEENAIALEELNRTLEVNKEMLEFVALPEKLKIFFENKKLNHDIATLKRERINLERADFSKANDALERIYAEKFNIAVQGDQKEALKETLIQGNVSYVRLWEDINKEIEAQTRKKSNASEDGQNK